MGHEIARWWFLIAVLFLIFDNAAICNHADIVVDREGNGDFKTITEAIDILPMYPYQRTIIFIKNGIYEEKLRLDQHYVTLRGENRDSTIIRFSILRSNWEKNKEDLGDEWPEAVLPVGEYVLITIQDTGRGIPSEVLPKVCDPYFSTQELGTEKGVGLGMAIAFSIVQKHEGQLHIESTKGVGTKVLIYLPVKPL